MKIFAVNTIVHREYQPVAFSVGDVLPDWAEGLVGDHCLESPAEPSDAPGDEGSDDPEKPTDTADNSDAVDDEAPAEPSDAPDFTKPARRGAARK